MTDRNDFVELATEKYGSKFGGLESDAVDDLFERYKEKLDTFGDESLALTAAVGSFNFDENMEGSTGEVDIIAVGNNGPRPFGDTPALFCYGVAIPEESKAGRVVIIVNEEDVSRSLHDVALDFTPYTSLTAEINMREASKVSGPHEGSGSYIGEIGSTDEPFSARESERDWDDRAELVKDHVPQARIAEISEHYSQRDGDYTANFGLDFKRIGEAVVLSARISANAGRYVFQDDSFLEPEELSAEVRGDDNDIGLAAWAEPHVATFDQESIVDVYGSITPSDDGQVTMRVYGAAPHMEGSIIPAEAPEASSDDEGSPQQSQESDSSSASSEPVEERTI